MPRVTHTAQVLKDAYGDYSVANAADYTYTAADPANDEQSKITGQEILRPRNTGAETHTITINSVSDPFGRTIVEETRDLLRFEGTFPEEEIGGLTELMSSSQRHPMLCFDKIKGYP